MKFLKIFVVVSILISLGWFISLIDINKVLSSVRLIGLNYIIILATTFTSYYLATIGWRYCIINKAKRINLNFLFIVRHIGETFSQVNPTSVVGGDAIKIFLLNNKGIDKETVVASVLLSRAILMISQVLLFLSAATLMLILHTPVQTNLLHIPVANILLVISFFVIIVFLARYILKAFTASETPLLQAFKQKIRNIRKVLLDIMVKLSKMFTNNPKALLMSFVFFSIHWIIGCLEFYLIMHLLGFKISLLHALFFDLGVVLFRSAGAFVPGQVGFEEYGNKIMLSSIGISSEEIWLTVTILRRGRQLFWILFALVAYLFISVTRSKLVAADPPEETVPIPQPTR